MSYIITTKQIFRYNINLTSSTLGPVFAAGKSGENKEDLSALPRLIAEKKTKLDQLAGEESKVVRSTLGTEKQIHKMRQVVEKASSKLECAISNIEKSRQKWVDIALPLFRLACLACRRVLVGPNGFGITVDKCHPGVYPSITDINCEMNTDGLPNDMVKMLIDQGKDAAKAWLDYMNASMDAWNEIRHTKLDLEIKKQTDIKDIVNPLKNKVAKLKKEEGYAQNYETYVQLIKNLTEEVNSLRKKQADINERMCENDPLLTSFSLPSRKNEYDREWLDKVICVASTRESMPYLPMSWADTSSAQVFDWRKAISEGRQNLYIEAATEEGLDGRMDMLDNFVATMLLAFPARQLHFTVLENRTINTFITRLPEKVCRVFDVRRDSDAISSLSRQLKEMYRAGRDNKTQDCAPREIVVFAGFEKGDRIFTEFMSNISEIVENGRRAGIYFAIVLDKDITQYDWKKEDANKFQRFFAPYSTILTNETDTDGNPLPDYELLRRNAKIEEDGKIKAGKLGELILSYLQSESETIQNKVYGLIESGEAYTAEPITLLSEQPRNDSNKLVVPIAQTVTGENIDMVLDDSDHMFYFVLGMTGSGKSYTLHTILTNLMLKYAPSVVDIILMDFKNGVEMANYKGVPHVSSILANGADPHVAGEILQSLKTEMNRRDDLFKDSGTNKISDYNAYAVKNGLTQMKHIVLLVDECQDLFKIDRPFAAGEFIADTAKKGRIYGVHMILATQTTMRAGIPIDALSQFSDFIFMKCAPEDIAHCGITDRQLQNDVRNLGKGEMFYCHVGDKPIHGYVYDYAGANDVYKNKTIKNLKSRRFGSVSKKQFYFDSAQIFYYDKSETTALIKKAKAGLKPISIAALGKKLSVGLDTVYTKLGRGNGTNLLILGANELLQAERVLWNAVLSLYDCNKAIDQEAKYYILPNIPDNVEAEAKASHNTRLEILRTIAGYPEVTLVEDEDNADVIEQVAATVRSRSKLTDSNSNSVNGLDAIYLVISNQQLFARHMGRKPKGLPPIDAFATDYQTDTKRVPAETSKVGGSAISMPINFISTGTPSTSLSMSRDYDDEMRYILVYGPNVNVHVIMHSTGPDKIFAGDTMSTKLMGQLFNDIVFLKMPKAGNGMVLPVNVDIVGHLNSDLKCLRALAYNGETDIIVPFEFNIKK